MDHVSDVDTLSMKVHDERSSKLLLHAEKSYTQGITYLINIFYELFLHRGEYLHRGPLGVSVRVVLFVHRDL